MDHLLSGLRHQLLALADGLPAAFPWPPVSETDSRLVL
jgi:hypothetical protein